MGQQSFFQHCVNEDVGQFPWTLLAWGAMCVCVRAAFLLNQRGVVMSCTDHFNQSISLRPSLLRFFPLLSSSLFFYLPLSSVFTSISYLEPLSSLLSLSLLLSFPHCPPVRYGPSFRYVSFSRPLPDVLCKSCTRPRSSHNL